VGDSNLRLGPSRGEALLEKRFVEMISPGDVVYDLGANIGWYALLAARLVGPEGRVLAFEPLLANAHYARANGERNGLQNMIVIPAAVTDEEGWTTFRERSSLGGRIEKHDTQAQADRRAKNEFIETGRSIVPTIALDSWLAQTGQPAPTLVKMDVEGAEVGALRGMRQTLASARPTLIIELHSTRDEVADELDANGYTHSILESALPTREVRPAYGVHVIAKARS
jgi:FkbM family methyltransferase